MQKGNLLGGFSVTQRINRISKQRSSLGKWAANSWVLASKSTTENVATFLTLHHFPRGRDPTALGWITSETHRSPSPRARTRMCSPLRTHSQNGQIPPAYRVFVRINNIEQHSHCGKARIFHPKPLCARMARTPCWGSGHVRVARFLEGSADMEIFNSFELKTAKQCISVRWLL